MTHDPLCRGGQSFCDCPLIARVREDEHTRVVCEVMSNHGDREIYAAGLRDATIAASNQRSKFKARDWDDAIDAVVAAIQDLQP